MCSVGDLQEAARCTGTTLLLQPGEDTATRNKEYYRKLDPVSEQDFLPRKVGGDEDWGQKTKEAESRCGEIHMWRIRYALTVGVNELVCNEELPPVVP